MVSLQLELLIYVYKHKGPKNLITGYLSCMLAQLENRGGTAKFFALAFISPL